MKKTVFILYLVSCFRLIGQETPAIANNKNILLLDGTAHIGNGNYIKRSAIAIKDGKITLVENALVKTIDTSGYDQVIRIKGKHVYPGFIACNSTIGLMDIEAVRASRDSYEVGEFNPNVRSIIAYNTDSKITPTVRSNGVLMGQICPKGGTISGSSSVVHFDAWNWEDAVVSLDEGIHLNWPKYNSLVDTASFSNDYQRALNSISSFFSRAKAYNNELNNSYFNIKLNALKGIFNGEQQLYVHVNFVKEINDVIQFKKDFKLQRLCVVGGADSWMIAKRIKENNISIMLPRTHRLPNYSHQDIHLPYCTAGVLANEGVLFCIQNAGDMQEMITRNLPFMVGTAIAYGLDYEKGVSAISLNAAKILGIDHTVGSIEEGKDATLFISSGDAFDVKTNNVEYAFIKGRLISLENDQIRKYKKYKKKYDLK
ncbi:MAG: amidohydrolase [Crocinitomicaceae bacterium]|nr:amidohydrolase [Crocinitomicaceae bacterium]|tara:strand:- start:2194 stop:3477 length:1284 start_codon:yes stop_codon:yes gene_type:complete